MTDYMCRYLPLPSLNPSSLPPHSAHVEPGWCLPRQLQVRLHVEVVCLLCNYSLPSSLPPSSLPPFFPPSLFLSRCSLMGFDLNRHWHAPSPWAHPTLHATKQLVMKYDQKEVTQCLLLNHLPLQTSYSYLSTDNRLGLLH